MYLQIYEKIISKKEFSELPKAEVEKVWNLFVRRETSEKEKIKLTRDMLRKVYFAFGSLKLLNPKIVDKKGVDEILKKHISTRERFDVYSELYSKLVGGFNGTIIDLGCGINGLSFQYFPSGVSYLGVEAVGQLVDLQNYYFKIKGIEKAGVLHESLFELEKLKKIIKSIKGEKVIFLFKVIDCLEMLERDYSKKLLSEVVPLGDKIVVSFATQSLIKKEKFRVKRYWFENFVKENFSVLEDFELGGERYIVLSKRN